MVFGDGEKCHVDDSDELDQTVAESGGIAKEFARATRERIAIRKEFQLGEDVTRSEERRVGKEGRSRGSPYHYKQRERGLVRHPHPRALRPVRYGARTRIRHS